MSTFTETAEGMQHVLRHLEQLVVLSETIHQMVKNGFAEQTTPLMQKRAGIIDGLQQRWGKNGERLPGTIAPELLPLHAAITHTCRRVQFMDKALATAIKKESAAVQSEKQAAAGALKTLRQFMPYYLKEPSQVSLTA
ncbi:MAG: hypothetical protein SWH68_06390 [Thermodesulfobacteriota bacterium]|nr:hypothetical protein [Thermodesulfobacteriota bacterium]